MAAVAAPPQAPDIPGLRANRACRHCVQVKAKCVPLEGSNNTICQRCQRLGKIVQLQPRHHANAAKQVHSSLRLEEKINSLTDLLTSGNGAGINSLPGPSNTEEGAGDKSNLSHPSLPTPPVSTTHEGNYVDKGPMDKISTVPDPDGRFKTCCKPVEIPPANPNFGTLWPLYSRKAFQRLSNGDEPTFPVRDCPHRTTATAFRTEKPFLFRTCITAACQTDPPCSDK